MKQKTISSLLLILSILVTSCQNEQNILKKKIADALTANDTKSLSTYTSEYIIKYPNDSVNILDYYINTSEKLLQEDKVNYILFLESIVEGNTNTKLPESDVLNFALKDLINYYSNSNDLEDLNKAFKYCERIRIENLSYYNYTEVKELSIKISFKITNQNIINKLISVVSGNYEKGNSIVGALTGDAIAKLTDKDLSITYNVFSPTNGVSEQYIETGTISDFVLKPDDSNYGYNLLYGYWNTEKVDKYGEIILKLKDAQNENRLHLIARSNKGANWKYICAKDFDAQSINNIKDLLKSQTKMVQIDIRNEVDKELSKDLNSPQDVLKLDICGNIYCNIAYKWVKLYDRLPKEYQSQIILPNEKRLELEFGDFNTINNSIFQLSCESNETLSGVGKFIKEDLSTQNSSDAFKAAMVFFYVKFNLLLIEDYLITN